MKKLTAINIKRILCVIAAFVLIIGLAACSSRDSSDSYGVTGESGGRGASTTNSAPPPAADTATGGEMWGGETAATAPADTAYYDYADDSGGGARYDSPTATQTSGMPFSDSYSGAQGPLMFIKRGDITLQTDTFDADVSNIRFIVETYSGYFESSNLYAPNTAHLDEKAAARNRKRYNAVIRIPVDLYEMAKEAIENTGKLVSSTESTQEVSAQYFNTQSRLATLKAEELRIIEFIEEAEDLKTLVSLEQRLAETRTQIDIYETQLKRLESQSSFSTIVVNITEATEEEMLPPEPPEPDPEPPTFLDRVKTGFDNSVKATSAFFQNLLVFLAYIIVPAALIAVIFFICRRVFRSKSKTKA